MTKVHYLAYGSNLHPLRLVTRVPSARVIGVVEMPGYMLAFHKRSIDGSGKCLLYTEQGANHGAFGVLYEFNSSDKAKLDAAEGKNNGYVEQLVQFPLNGETYTPYIYIAEPSHINGSLHPYDWYKSLVLAGAYYHDFPAEYIAKIEATPSIPDLNKKRTNDNEELLRAMGFGNSQLVRTLRAPE